MGKNGGARSAGSASVQAVEERVAEVARALSMELVEVVWQRESRGKCLCIYIDKEGGVSLDDCERFHRQVQPLLEDVEYDFLEVSSPGIDRPVKTMRDFERNRGALVEVKLFAALDGSKLYRGLLRDMTEERIVLTGEDGKDMAFARKGVAIVKPVIELDDDDFSDLEVE